METPEFEDDGVECTLEFTQNGNDWIAGTVQQVSYDGRVLAERDDNEGYPEWVHLPRTRFRWTGF